MSSRKKRRTLAASTANNESASIPGPSQLVKSKGSRRTRGKLSALLELPLDIILEIFSFLLPLDLLHLSRLNKDFRKVLMSKSSIGAWKAARQNLPGFPGPFLGMSEPAWVNLAFMAECHYCTRTVRNADMYLMTRVCPPCASERLIKIKTFELQAKPPSAHVSVADVTKLIPTHRTGYRRGDHTSPKDWDWWSLRRDYDVMCAKLLSFDTSRERSEFIKNQTAFVSANFTHSRICHTWNLQRANERYREIHQGKKDRLQAIHDKLKELGYEEDLKGTHPYLDPLASHPLVKKNAPLTERGWSKIRDELVSWAELRRANRLAVEHEKLVNSRKPIAVSILQQYKNDRAHYPVTTFFPSVADFCQFLPIKEILDLPSDTEVNEESFSGVIPQLPELCRQWRGRIKRKLTKLLLQPNPKRTRDETVHQLQLACNVVICHRCSEFPDTARRHRGQSASQTFFVMPLFYPQMLSHQCMQASARPVYKFASLEDRTVRLNYPAWHVRAPWSTEYLVENDKFRSIVQRIVKMVNLDPATTTVAEMDADASRFACLLCEKEQLPELSSQMFILYRWRELAQHIFQSHFYVTATFPRRVLKFDHGELPSNYRYVAPASTVMFRCVHCHDLPSESPKNNNGPEDITRHMNTLHPDVTTPKLNKDFYIPFGTPSEPHKGQIFVAELSNHISEESLINYEHALEGFCQSYQSQFQWETDPDAGVHFDELDEDDLLDEDSSDDESGSDEDSEALSSS
ncbi:uncharacterized protein EV420DRAFT_1519542 [Desarmillaria tabescens]|uniref:F-box domain-containing protein n=1 Tax=Armillaria tabescens TaxID=1929756 RepID=A0AA39NDK8_ARMTA|nr:uncharacterized protein EV420DRAFT_1519542 [Desarmillaria tabescens]KAK0463698.1 hypothetical protein EV420DRAFT_1519542 [Desarmillaria tabescens]